MSKTPLKMFEVFITATATVSIWKEIEAASEKEAKEIFANKLRRAQGLELEPEGLEYKVVEVPLETHDWNIEDIEVTE